MPIHIEIATAKTDASTPHAPLTPQSQAAALSECRPTRRMPTGKQQPRSIDNGAVKASTTSVRPGRLKPDAICAAGSMASLVAPMARPMATGSSHGRRDAPGSIRMRSDRKLPMPVQRIIEKSTIANVYVGCPSSTENRCRNGICTNM
jgi:hypothetical protein